MYKPVAVLPERFNSFGFLFKNINCRKRRRANRRRQSGAVDKTSCMVDEKVDELSAACGIGSEGTKGFSERAHLDMHASGESKMLY